VIFSDEALREGVAMAKLRGKDLTTAEVKAIVNAVLALEVAREIQRRPTGPLASS
jgi:hypothetical protein